MPTFLLQRCTRDCIQQFHRAAFERIEDGYRLGEVGRTTAAIYVWGYAIEMILKARYFGAVGFSPTQHITVADLTAAKNSSSSLGFPWRGNLHSLDSWANLLVHWRANSPHAMYSSPRFPQRILSESAKMSVIWRETLRYHWNRAYPFEIRRARCAVEWFHANSHRLWHPMARIRASADRLPSKHRKLTEELVSELRANRDYGQPFIKEQEFPQTGALRVSVIWDKWHHVPEEDRYSTIMEAYEQVEGKEFRDRIALAIGLTVPEAYEAGMLPYQVITMLRRDDPVTLEQCRDAVLKEGASALFDQNVVQLRFGTIEEAEAAVDRLKENLPGSEPIWGIAQEVARIED